MGRSGSESWWEFTLIHLLIVVAIIGVLAVIAIQNLLSAQNKANISKALADTRQIVMQTHLYHNDFNAYPTGVSTLMTAGYLSRVYDPFGATATQEYGFGTAGPVWALSIGPPGGGASPPSSPRTSPGPSSTNCSGTVGYQTDYGAIGVTGC